MAVLSKHLLCPIEGLLKSADGHLSVLLKIPDDFHSLILKHTALACQDHLHMIGSDVLHNAIVLRLLQNLRRDSVIVAHADGADQDVVDFLLLNRRGAHIPLKASPLPLRLGHITRQGLVERDLIESVVP